MTEVLLNEVVMTDFGQFEIQWGETGWDGDADRAFAGQENGLVGAAADDYVYVSFGRRSGGSHVRIELSDQQPELDDSWRDCVEVSVSIPEGHEPRWLSWAGESGGALSLPPGSYRLRVSANDREAGANDEFSPQVVDFYLLQLWPADLRPDEIVRVAGTEATYWHESWGNRR